MAVVYFEFTSLYFKSFIEQNSAPEEISKMRIEGFFNINQTKITK